MKEQGLRNYILNSLKEIDFNRENIDENIILAIQDYHSSVPEFEERDFQAVEEFLKVNREFLFEIVADEEQLYSENYDKYLDYFMQYGYLY